MQSARTFSDLNILYIVIYNFPPLTKSFRLVKMCVIFRKLSEQAFLKIMKFFPDFDPRKLQEYETFCNTRI